MDMNEEKLIFINIKTADGRSFKGYEINREAPVIPGYVALSKPVEHDDTIYLNRDQIISIEVDPIEIGKMYNIFYPIEIISKN